MTHCLPVRIECVESGGAGVVFVDDGARGARGRAASEGGVVVLDDEGDILQISQGECMVLWRQEVTLPPSWEKKGERVGITYDFKTLL